MNKDTNKNDGTVSQSHECADNTIVSADSAVEQHEKNSINNESPKSGLKANKEEKSKEKELGGPKGLEPTRYGDWESKGRCYDF